MAANQTPVFDDFLKIAGLPFSSGSIIRENYCKKIAKDTLSVGQSFSDSTTFEAFPSASHISITDCVG